MAVSLPLFLLLYEIIFHRPAWRAVCLTGVITLVYIAGKLTGPGSLLENPAYALTISPIRFLKTFHLYLNPLLYQDHWFHDSNTVQLLVGMLAFAVWRRNRTLLFAWFWLLLTILPVSFIAHYAAFFEYLPAAGWALYAATLLVMARHALLRLLPRALARGPMLQRTSQAVLFLGVTAFLAPLHSRQAPKTLQLFMSVQPPSTSARRELLRAAAGTPPRCAYSVRQRSLPQGLVFSALHDPALLPRHDAGCGADTDATGATVRILPLRCRVRVPRSSHQHSPRREPVPDQRPESL